jgi:hypothetical protein
MINIDSANIPIEKVEGLKKAIDTLAENGLKTMERVSNTRETLHSTINLTFEHGKKIEELNKQNQNRFAEIEHVEYVIIPKIKTLLIALHIMVLGLFIFDLGVVWYIIKH